MTFVDEYVILRFLLDDDPEASAQAHNLIAQGDAITYAEVLKHTIATLNEVYKVPRTVISAALVYLLDDVAVEHEHVVRLALRLYGSAQIDFSECLVVAHDMHIRG